MDHYRARVVSSGFPRIRDSVSLYECLANMLLNGSLLKGVDLKHHISHINRRWVITQTLLTSRACQKRHRHTTRLRLRLMNPQCLRLWRRIQRRLQLSHRLRLLQRQSHRLALGWRSRGPRLAKSWNLWLVCCGWLGVTRPVVYVHLKLLSVTIWRLLCGNIYTSFMSATLRPCFCDEMVATTVRYLA